MLKLYIAEKEQCLNQLNGFFSFCIYDKAEQTFFLARDRFGIKPLLYLFDEDKFLFASEMKSILQYGIEKNIDYSSLYTYLQLNYIPAPDTIFTNVKKLLPGHYLKIGRQKIETAQYYSIPYDQEKSEANTINYQQAKEKVRSLLELSVQRRMVSDVPLGTFLSGGIDSSIITGLASRNKADLHSFSIGFKDEKFFDETQYARLVAKHFKTEHTVFSLTNNDLYTHLHSILEYIDEPFADSSAIAVYILSKETHRTHPRPASHPQCRPLSGDGADEMLGGYNKHAAFNRVINPGMKEQLVSSLSPVWKFLPKSRSGSFSNRIRQLERFSAGMKLSSKDRYWKWAGFVDKDEALLMLHKDLRINMWLKDFFPRRKTLLQSVPDRETLNDILYADMQLVLPNDMLTKVDLMSMANGLEVRVPFLDFEFVNFIFSLPSSFKVGNGIRKRILKDAFRDFLPRQLYNRPKKGFEVPLLKWFRYEMKSLIVDDLLSEKFITDQAVFDYAEVRKLKEQLFSSNPGDVHARIWGLIVFQSWWKKYMMA